MADLDSFSQNLLVGEIYFVTLSENSNRNRYWIFEEESGRYFDVVFPEFFYCTVYENFELPLDPYEFERH